MTLPQARPYLILLGIYALCTLPKLLYLPDVDAGVYMNAGYELLKGQRPYLDFWDHKLPLIYLLNAAMLWLGGGSAFAPGAIMALLGAAALLGSYRFFSRQLSPATALLAFAPLAVLLTNLNYNNSPEGFALLFGLLALACFWQLLGGRQVLPWALALGLCAGSTLMLKPNLASLYAGIGLALLIQPGRHWRGAQWAAAVGGGLVGLLLPLAGIWFWLRQNGALDAFHEQAWRYNQAYIAASSTALITRIKVSLVAGGVFPVGFFLALWGGIAWWLWRGAGGWPAKLGGLLRAFWLQAPIELLMASLSGRAYGHYYLLLLPGLLAFAAVACWEAQRRYQWPHWGMGLLLGLLLLPQISEAAYAGAAAWRDVRRQAPALRHLKRYTAQHSTANDKMLVFGTYFNSLHPYLDREAASRFTYQLPLVTRGYAHDSLMHNFMAEAAAGAPFLIVNTVGPPLPRLSDGSIRLGDDGYAVAEGQFDAWLAWVRANYEQREDLSGFYGQVYTRKTR